jgi:hypothetical protein
MEFSKEADVEKRTIKIWIRDYGIGLKKNQINDIMMDLLE